LSEDLLKPKFYVRVDGTTKLIPLEWNEEALMWVSPVFEGTQIVSVEMHPASGSPEEVSTKAVNKGDRITIPWEGVNIE
jgi:hypothetical protein